MSIKNLTFVNNNPPACDDEFLNSVRNETNNAITQSGQSLTGIGDSEQLSKGISNYVASGAFYSCSNVGDAYTLTPLSLFKGITAYKDGQLFRFRPSATNTTQSPTINVNSQGPKNITKADGSTQVDIGDIDSSQDIELRYDLANDVFILPKISENLIPTLYIGGLNTENYSGDTAHDIKFNIGSCRDATDTQDIFLGSPLIKQIDANWVAGTGNGGFPSGLTLTANTTYHMFVIAKPDGTVDAGFDTSLTATNLLADATGYTKYRRVMSMDTDVSLNWIQYVQKDGFVSLKTVIRDVNTGTSGTGKIARTMTIPTGIQVLVNLTFDYGAGGGSGNILFIDPDQTKFGAQHFDDISNVPKEGCGRVCNLLSNTSSQIYTDTTASLNLDVYLHSWFDFRN